MPKFQVLQFFQILIHHPENIGEASDWSDWSDLQGQGGSGVRKTDGPAPAETGISEWVRDFRRRRETLGRTKSAGKKKTKTAGRSPGYLEQP